MNTATTIHCARLDLIPMTPDFLTACLRRDQATAAESLGVPVPDEWFGKSELIALRLEQLLDDPDFQPWCLRAVVLRDSREMVGHIGFHTRPDPTRLIWRTLRPMRLNSATQSLLHSVAGATRKKRAVG